MKYLYNLLFIFFCGALTAQNVNIPDNNFKNYLVTNTEVNTNGDSEIQVSEAIAFTGTLAFQFWFVEDLTGIEAFVNLTILDCGDNNLTSLDLSQNVALEQLYCYDNQITNLDLSGNPLLFALDCRNNQIDNLDLSTSPALEYLQCTFNEMNSLNLSQNTALTTLRCFSNNLTELELTNNTALVNLYANFNDIESLDLSQNSALEIIECSTNELTELDVSNGNNTNVTNYTSVGNPNLECIQVDDAAYSIANWNNVDATSTFTEDCENLGLNESLFANTVLYPNPATETLKFSISTPGSYKVLSVQGQTQKQGYLHEGANEIDVASLASGIYFLQFQNGRTTENQRFIKN